MASNANTEDTRDALNSPEPRRRPLRSPKPSAKVRETLVSLGNKAKAAKNTSSAATRPDGGTHAGWKVQQLDNVKNRVAEEQKQVAEELKQVYAQLDAISLNLAITTTTISTSPNPSYANVARTPPNSSQRT
ncbi:hypothetical protein N657DRAFT_632076 [Parathielavia appendiculata]|uniref:Uncharacterized protein n=1 Tax=Parathielavia appendiculata TaxID=2587402 RepID=A0AAN6Z5K0_9PEZI|nr:hypothetical protein N657DRAFT_632076 [Parathielavia appendiculata]